MIRSYALTPRVWQPGESYGKWIPIPQIKGLDVRDLIYGRLAWVFLAMTLKGIPLLDVEEKDHTFTSESDAPVTMRSL